MDYVSLQVKTSYSLLSSLCDIKKLISKAKNLGYTSLAITDKNNMYGVMNFYNECINNNIKPIIGLELDIEDNFLLLYAINYQGYVNLCKLVTIKSERNITIADLKQYKDNLTCIIPFCLKDTYKDYKKIYDKLYIGYKNVAEREKIYIKEKVLITDVLYLENNDYKYLNYLYMIRDMKKDFDNDYDDLKGHHLLNNNEVSILSTIDDVNISKEISHMCNMEFKKYDSLLPIYDKNIESFKYLTSLCIKGLTKRLNSNIPKEYVTRLNYELDIINKMGFNNYFLVVWDFIKYAKQNKILVGPGRGSAAGSLVSYTLGITDIDPIKYDLVFERFLNPERITMPDIDVDFDAYKRNEVIDYVSNKYGNKKVAQIITFGTMASKQVIRDVSRCMDINIRLVDKLASLIIPNKTLIESYKANPKLRELINSSNELKKLYDVSLHLEGVPRHTSIHAAGVVMSELELDNIIPLHKQDEFNYLTGYSMEYLEQLGLLKMDFLGLKNLTIISKIMEDLSDSGINIFDIPYDDKAALKVFYDVNTVGIFQFESIGMKSFLRKLRATSFDDIVAAIALFRPGPMDNIDTYIRRRHGKEKIKYIHPSLEKILNKTYGIIIYQEQIIEIASVIAGYSLGEADVLRRAMSKKKEQDLLKEKEKFVAGAIKGGCAKEIANSVYELILKFANYGFNKSHSVAYSIIGYKMAYLKAHYPNYFITNLLKSVIGSEIKTREYITEAKRNNIKIILPDINISHNTYKVTKDGIIYPLTNIRNIGYTVANEIIEKRENNNYIDFIDFVSRCYSRSVNKKVIISLINAGCFNEFGYNKQTFVNNLDAIINYAEIINNVGSEFVLKPELEDYPEFSKQELLEREKEVFGFYLSMHPVDRYKKDKDINLSEVNNYFDKLVTTIIYVEYIKEIKTKNNMLMAFISGTDDTGDTEFILFPKVYDNYLDVKKGDIIRITGKVEKRFDKYQVIVKTIEQVD